MNRPTSLYCTSPFFSLKICGNPASSNSVLCSVASVVSDSATLWNVACQAPLSMGSSRQEYWSELLCPSPGDLPDPGIEPISPGAPALQAGSLPTEPPGSPLSESTSPIFPRAFAHGVSRCHTSVIPADNNFFIIIC